MQKTWTDSDAVTVDYTFGSYTTIEALTTKSTELDLVFAGLNEADSGKPVMVEIFRASQGVSKSLALITGNGFATLEVEGNVPARPQQNRHQASAATTKPVWCNRRGRGMAFKPLQIIIGAKDEASAVFGRLQTKIAALGVAVAGYFWHQDIWRRSKKALQTFEAAMSRVEAAHRGQRQRAEGFRKAASDAGANTEFKAVEAAAALENLAKAGLDTTQSIKTLEPVLNLAAAADVELATAAEYVTKAVMGMGLSFDDAGRVADVLAMGANATNTSVAGLAQSLSYAAPLPKPWA